MHGSTLAPRSLSIAALAAALVFFGGCRESPEEESAPKPEVETKEREGAAEPTAAPKAAGASTEVSAVRIRGARVTLDRHLRRWALKSPENTWALIHALFVFPSDMKLPDHDVTILDAILAEATTTEVGGRRVPTFTGAAKDGTPREPHHNQVVMVLLGTGVDPEHEFEADGRQFTVRDLVESALWRFQPPRDEAWEHESWTLTALAYLNRHNNGRTEFENHEGRRFDVHELVRRTAAHLNQEMQFIEHARDSGEELQKTRKGVHSHPCGGLHLASTPAIWMDDEELREKLVPAMERAASTLAWRVVAEQKIYERARQEFPGHDIMVNGQEMKFYGHWLETMADLRDAGIEVDRESVDKGVAFLVQAVENLDRIGAFRHMDEVRRRRAQTYRDLIGDAAHALRGLRLWTEEQ